MCGTLPDSAKSGVASWAASSGDEHRPTTRRRFGGHDRGLLIPAKPTAYSFRQPSRRTAATTLEHARRWSPRSDAGLADMIGGASASSTMTIPGKLDRTPIRDKTGHMTRAHCSMSAKLLTSNKVSPPSVHKCHWATKWLLCALLDDALQVALLDIVFAVQR